MHHIIDAKEQTCIINGRMDDKAMDQRWKMVSYLTSAQNMSEEEAQTFVAEKAQYDGTARESRVISDSKRRRISFCEEMVEQKRRTKPMLRQENENAET